MTLCYGKDDELCKTRVSKNLTWVIQNNRTTDIERSQGTLNHGEISIIVTQYTRENHNCDLGSKNVNSIHISNSQWGQ